MSDLKAKQSGIRFEPIAEREEKRPGIPLLLFGVLFPAFVIVVELAWRLCAQELFDPMPTAWHVAAVGSVPAVNLLIWHHLRSGTARGLGWLAFASGAAMAIAGFYTLVFLPLMPLAAIAIIVYGLGILAFGPLTSLISAIVLRRRFRQRHADNSHRPRLLAGLASAALLLLVLDVPSAATRIGMRWAVSGDVAERQRGVTLLRTLGDDDFLLRLCYDTQIRAPGLLTWLIAAYQFGVLRPAERMVNISPTDAREVYYRVHGEPFNYKPAPYTGRRWSRFGDFDFDRDLGGTEVGGRVRGLSLTNSQIDGSISADDAVAYLEWVFEFTNTSEAQREARLELALPPGAVVSRATLWINGEEREAAYGGRGEVRAAYQRVAVQQRRDPLLVTTKGADRVLAQAFPINPGGTIKFKIGISAPLDLADASSARLTLPAIVDRNFSFASDVSHKVWIESRTALTGTAPSLTASQVNGGVFRLGGTVTDQMLSRTRQSITASRNADVQPRLAQLASGEIIRQDIAAVPAVPPSGLMLVIDGSVRLRPMRTKLLKALDAIPAGARVGLSIAQEPVLSLPIAPWTPAQKQAAIGLIDQAAFAGGQDNEPVLADALLALEAEPHGMLIWIHGPQPVSFRASAGRLTQASTRLTRFPEVVLYAVEPGPNQLLPDTPRMWGARSLPQTGAADADIGGFLARTWDTAPHATVQRSESPSTDGPATGSQHIARLWAKDRVLTLMQNEATRNRTEATDLAARYRLVTPVSGAVVLETQQQYDASRLTAAGQATVPTVPEPHEWVLLIIVCLALIGLGWQQRQRFAVAAS